MQILNRIRTSQPDFLLVAFFLMSLVLVTSAGCDPGAVTDCDSRVFTVTTTEDINDGQCTEVHCSLREAVIAQSTCERRMRREIHLSSGTYTLSLRGPGDERGDLNISGVVGIWGTTADRTLIQGDSSWNDRIFAVPVGAEVGFRHLTIQGGNSSGDGGAILNNGQIWLRNVKLASNSAAGRGGGLYSTGIASVNLSEIFGNFSEGCGGGFHNTGQLSIDDSLVQDNNGEEGHGICSENAGSLYVRTSEIFRNGHETFGTNQGGGIYVASSGQTQISDTTIHNNRASSGGGIYASSEASDLRLTGVTLSENHAYLVTGRDGTLFGGRGGGLFLSAANYFIGDTLIIDNIADAEGGGLYVTSFDESVDGIKYSAIARNTAQAGGGIFLRAGEVLIRHSTISSNRAVLGSAIYNTAPGEQVMNFAHVTISNNGAARSALALGAGALYTLPGTSSWFTIRNTIIAENLEEACFGVPDNYRTAGYNYAESLACFYGDASTDIPAASLSSSDIDLSPLTDDGSTLIHSVPPWSAVVDRIPRDEFWCLTDGDDQRHVLRPQGDLCDIGAYEVNFEMTSLEGVDIPPPSLNRDALCWKGPGSAWETVSSVLNETEVIVLGVGALEGWLVIENPRYPGVQCWLPEESIDHELDLSTLLSFAVPPLPTPTGEVFLGCMHQGQNDNAAVCYVPCPPNPTDGTACNP